MQWLALLLSGQVELMEPGLRTRASERPVARRGLPEAFRGAYD